MALWASLFFQPVPSPRAEQAPRPLTHTSLPRPPNRPRFPALTDTYLDMEVGFVMPLGHLMQSGISSNPGVTFCSLEKDGEEGGTQPGQAPSRVCHHGPCMSLRPGHFPHLIFKKAFASNVLEQIELEPNKAVVICKLEMLQSAQD